MSLDGKEELGNKGGSNNKIEGLSDITSTITDAIWNALRNVGKGTSEENYLVRKLVSESK